MKTDSRFGSENVEKYMVSSTSDKKSNRFGMDLYLAEDTGNEFVRPGDGLRDQPIPWTDKLSCNSCNCGIF